MADLNPTRDQQEAAARSLALSEVTDLKVVIQTLMLAAKAFNFDPRTSDPMGEIPAPIKLAVGRLTELTRTPVEVRAVARLRSECEDLIVGVPYVTLPECLAQFDPADVLVDTLTGQKASAFEWVKKATSSPYACEQVELEWRADRDPISGTVVVYRGKGAAYKAIEPFTFQQAS